MVSDPRKSPPSPLADLREALAAEPAEDRAALERVWHLLGDAAPPADSATDDRWAALRARIDAPPPARRAAADRPPARPASRRRFAFVLAAAVVVVAGGVAWGTMPVSETAPAGETLAVTVADGSRVTLNSGATLRHPRRFFGDRVVALRGEAFFEVAHASAPFVVETHNARVAVLGTAFNVRTSDTSDETAVALVRGRVRVTGVAGSDAELVPGQAVVVDASGVTAPAAANVGRAASWRYGALAFDGRPLGDVLAEIERRYDVSLDAAPGVPLGTRVSAFYTERPALDALLGDIGAASGVRFAPSARGYTVRPAPRPGPAGAGGAPFRAAP